jgi:hypothetical protein
LIPAIIMPVTGELIDNIIPICDQCNNEIHLAQSAKGIAFTSDELRGHRKQWLEDVIKIRARTSGSKC